MLALLMRNQGLLGENPGGKNILPNTVLPLTKIDSYVLFCKKKEISWEKLEIILQS